MDATTITALTTTLTEWHWEKRRDVSWTVSWMPLTADVHLSESECHNAPTLWATEDEPPVYVALDPTSNHPKLKVDIEQLAGETEAIYRARKVRSLDDLEPGCYFIHE